MTYFGTISANACKTAWDGIVAIHQMGGPKNKREWDTLDGLTLARAMLIYRHVLVSESSVFGINVTANGDMDFCNDFGTKACGE